MSDLEPILVSVRFRSTEIEQVILEECPVCYAAVPEGRLQDHVGGHS